MLYDPFEPLMMHSLEWQTPNLGYLIFGHSQWLSLASDAEIPISDNMGNNALLHYYAECNAKCKMHILPTLSDN